MSAEPRILVAGVGDVLVDDHGFGPAVVRRLRRKPQPPGVRAVDFGTSAFTLAVELVRGYDALVLVAACRCGEPPGTLTLVEPGPGAFDPNALVDPHELDPASVLHVAGMLAAWPAHVVVLACEPGGGHASTAVRRGVELCERTVAELRTGRRVEVRRA